MEEYTEEEQLFAVLTMLTGLAMSGRKQGNTGLTRYQLMILITLYQKRGMSMSELAEAIATSREQTSRATAALVDNGYLERFELPENRTRVYVRLTEKGNAWMDEEVRVLHQLFEEKIYEKLTDTELQEMKSAFAVLYRILGKLMDASVLAK